MKKISHIGILSLILFLTNQVVATEHLVSKHDPAALSSQQRTTEVFENAANIESSLLLAQADTNTQETTQAEFERRQERIEELEASIHKRLQEAQPKQSAAENLAPAKLEANGSKSGTWKTLAILAAVILGLLTLLRMWWQNRQEKEMEAQAIQEAIGSADSDISTSDVQDGTPSDKISTKPDIVTTADTASELESDPISAAAIFLAFEQRDRAIKVLNDAVIKSPAQGDITNKLLTLYANDGNVNAFTSLFESAADSIEDEQQWAKIKALAEATIPEHKIHAYDTNASVPVLQDTVQDEQKNSLNPDELSAHFVAEDTDPRIVAEDTDPMIVVEDTSAPSNFLLSDSNIPKADAKTPPESRTQEKPANVDQEDLKTTLALAKAYLDIENDATAAGFLTDVISNDKGALGQEAQLLLDSLDQDLIDRIVNSQPNIKDKQKERLDQQAVIERAVVIQQDIEAVDEPLPELPQANADAEAFDLILDEELEEVNIHDPETALTLAKAYIDLGEYALARDFLMDASATENQQDKAEIRSLLEILEHKENDHTQETVQSASHKKARSGEGSNTEGIQEAHIEDHETTDTPGDRKPAEHVNELIDEPDMPGEEDPNISVQNKIEAQQDQHNGPGSEADIETTAQYIGELDKTTQETAPLLALAKSYIALEEYNLARNFLNQVLQSGHQADEAEAQKLLSVLNDGGDLDFIFNFDRLPDNLDDAKLTNLNDEARDAHLGTDKNPVEGDVPGVKDMQGRDSISPHTEDISELKVEQSNINVEINSDEDPSLDSQEILDDQKSKAGPLALDTVGDTNLKELDSKDDPENPHVDAQGQLTNEERKPEEGSSLDSPSTSEDQLSAEKAFVPENTRLENLTLKTIAEYSHVDSADPIQEHAIDQESEIVEFEPHDPETALELAKAYIELGDEKTAREVLEEVARSDKKKCVLQAQDILATLDSNTQDAAIAQQAVASGSSSVLTETDDDESILIETERHDPETAIELAYAYIKLGEEEIATEILREIIGMATSSENIKAKAKVALSSLT